MCSPLRGMISPIPEAKTPRLHYLLLCAVAIVIIMDLPTSYPLSYQLGRG